MCVPGAHRDQKRAPNLLELELQMVLRHHVGSGNQALDLSKSSQCSELLNHVFSLKTSVFKDIFKFVKYNLGIYISIF